MAAMNVVTVSVGEEVGRILILISVLRYSRQERRNRSFSLPLPPYPPPHRPLRSPSHFTNHDDLFMLMETHGLVRPSV